MTKAISFFRRKLLFLLIPSLVVVAYFGSTVFPSSAKKAKTVIRVSNLARFCDIVAERDRDHLKLSVKNNNDKAITAFDIHLPIDSGTVFEFREELLFSETDTVIPPGQSYDSEIGIPGSLRNKPEIAVTFSAVMYADGSSEGDPKTIHDIVESREGRKIQLMKIIPVLDRMTQLPDEELHSFWIKTAKEEFDAALNQSNKDALLSFNARGFNETESEQFKSGERVGKDTIARHYERLKAVQEEQGVVALRNSLVELRDLYTKFINSH